MLGALTFEVRCRPSFLPSTDPLTSPSFLPPLRCKLFVILGDVGLSLHSKECEGPSDKLGGIVRLCGITSVDHLCDKAFVYHLAICLSFGCSIAHVATVSGHWIRLVVGFLQSRRMRNRPGAFSEVPGLACDADGRLSLNVNEAPIDSAILWTYSRSLQVSHVTPAALTRRDFEMLV